MKMFTPKDDATLFAIALFSIVASWLLARRS